MIFGFRLLREQDVVLAVGVRGSGVRWLVVEEYNVVVKHSGIESSLGAESHQRQGVSGLLGKVVSSLVESWLHVGDSARALLLGLVAIGAISSEDSSKQGVFHVSGVEIFFSALVSMEADTAFNEFHILHVVFVLSEERAQTLLALNSSEIIQSLAFSIMLDSDSHG